MSLIIGLTGGIGSGKTTVANLFAAKGIDIIDADIIARDVVAIGSAGLAAIINKFGRQILLPDDSLNRSELRNRVFSDPSVKTWLDNLLHPLIHQQLREELNQATSPYCLLVAPLLIENNLHGLCQRILVVDVPTETQILRTCQRDNVSREQVEAILSAQISRNARLSYADDIVKNGDSNSQLDVQVMYLHAKYLALSDNSHDEHEQ